MRLNKSNIGNSILLLLLAINLLLWIFFTPPLQEGQSAKQLLSEFFSSTAMILMAFSIVLSTRARGFESFFGGLDKMYMAHKRNGILAILFLVLHFFTLSKVPSVEGQAMNPGGPLGMLAFLGLLIMVVLAVAPRIPFIGGYIKLTYSRWKISHKAIGVFFIIGFVHMFLVDTAMERSKPLGAFVSIISIIGVLAYIYKIVIFGFVRRKSPYRVKEANHLNPSVIEVVLEPLKKSLKYKAGQFLFVEFEGDKLLSESHPFTISSGPSNDNIHLSIRASGDYTKHVYETLKPGTDAMLEGSYGRFDYTTGKSKQIWVAGGIGLTPFLSWVREFPEDSPHEVDLFYTVRSKEDALFLDEFTSADARFANFRFHLFCSNVDGHLNAEKIESITGSVAERDCYFCGPAPMTEGIAQQLKGKGVSAKDVHFEEFSFR